MVNNKSQTGTSENTKTIVTVILLVFAYPIGMIMMWVWTKWPLWLKILLTAPIVIFFLGIFAAIALVTVNPIKQLDKARQAGYKTCLEVCSTNYQVVEERNTCIQSCDQRYSATPAISPVETSTPQY